MMFNPGKMEESVLTEVKEEAVGSVPVTAFQEGVLPPVTMSEEGVVPPIMVCEEGLVNLWRAIGSAKGFLTDSDLAKFLMSLYINYHDPDPEAGGSGDVTTGRLQTDNQADRPSSQEVGSPTDNQTDWPSSRDGKTQTVDAQCSKCSRPLALVCINRQCRSSPAGKDSKAASGTAGTSRLPPEDVTPLWLRPEPLSSRHPRRGRALLKKAQPSAPSSRRAQPSDVGRVTDRSSGEEMDAEEFSGFEAESSAEDSDLDTVMSEGYPAQAKLSLTIFKKKAPHKKRAPAPANLGDNNLQPIVKLYRCDFPEHGADRKRQRAPLSQDDVGKMATSPPAKSARRETATSPRVTSARRGMAPSQQSTSARQETATSPRSTSARRSTRSSGPLEVVQPAEQPVTTATGKYPIVDGVAYRDGRMPVAIGQLELKCSRCHKTFPDTLFMNRHIKNPSCDDGNDDLFKVTRSKKIKRWRRRQLWQQKDDKAWVPKSTLEEVEMMKIPVRFKEVWSKHGVTVQEFMTGKVQVPICSDQDGQLEQDSQLEQGGQQKQDWGGKWHCSHHTCFKCYTVFLVKRAQFLKHEEECNGIRDRDKVEGGEHAVIKGVGMATADSRSSEDVAKTNSDCQLIHNLAKTTADGHLAKTTADGQQTNDLAKTTTDGQQTNDLAKTTADGQPTNDLAKTTANDQLTRDLTKTTADNQLAEDGADQSRTDDDPPPPQPGGEDRQLDAKSIEILARVKERYLFSCPRCDLLFFNAEHQKMHAVSHLYSKEEDSGVFTCQLCDESFQKYGQIYNHLRVPRRKNSQCQQCGLRFESRCQMYPHMKQHWKEASQLKGQASAEARAAGLPTGRKHKVSMLCPICGKLFTGQFLLQRHIRNHGYDREKPFACTVCGKEFKWESSLKAHQATHDGPHFQCEVCGQDFYTVKAMRNHTKVKHLGQVFRCEHCGKRLSHKGSLDLHIKRVHLKIKSHTCSICGLRTAEGKAGLIVHMRSHTGEKPFQCKICLVRFARVDYLKKHMRLHTGERPFKCDDCPQSFVCASSLKHHRLRQHSDKKFPCDVCDKVFLISASRDYHKYKFHGEAIASTIFSNNHPSRTRFPCDICGKITRTAAERDFHFRTHQDSDQKSSEHQDSDQKSSEYQDSDQKSSEQQDSDQKSSEYQDSDQKSSEHQDSDQKSSEHQESDQKSLKQQDSDQS